MGVVKKLQVFQTKYMKKGAKKLINMVVVPARIRQRNVSGICPSQRLKIRRQVAEILGRQRHASLDIFSEVKHVELEDEVAYPATFYKAWNRQVFGSWNNASRSSWRGVL